ncbi:MAG: leucyl aminopeptidase [Pseudomonadota bacterium]
MKKRFMYLTLLWVAGPLLSVWAMPALAEPTRVAFLSELPESKDWVLGVYADGMLGVYGELLDEKLDGELQRYLSTTEFEATPMSSEMLPGSGADRVLLVGLGDRDAPRTVLEWQEIGGSSVQAAIAAFEQSPVMVFDVSDDVAANVGFGAKLGSYYFDRYLSDPGKKSPPELLRIITPQAEQAQRLYDTQLEPLANGIWWARDVSNEPANVIYPESFVAFWKQRFKQVDGVRVRALDERDIEKRGMGALYGVGQGSQHPPRLLIAEYRGGQRDAPPVVIVGKGITFDTGGISIKPWDNMWNMKFDMAGAASAMGTLYALAGRKAPLNVVAIAALAENMPGAKAQRPGDIVQSLSGKTIEVRQTDAEGRLVLADAVHYADVTYHPALLVDIATLTGAAVRALGSDYAALLTRHDELVPDFIAAGKASGEELWQLPLNDSHFDAVASKVADVTNFPKGGPGASTGAAFIGEFVREDTHWVHLDIAGVSSSDKATPLKRSPGATSFAIRLLNLYLQEHFEPLQQ